MSTISTTLSLVDNFSSTFNKIVNNLKNAQGQSGFGGFAAKTVGALSKLHPALNAIYSGLEILKPVVGAITNGFKKLAASANQCIQAYQYQSEQELKLATIMRQRIGASDKEIQSIKDFASAQQELGIYGDELILQGAQELASFTSNTKAIETLIPAMNNLIAQQYGYSASGQTFQSTADMMGKVLSGQVGALSRLGYVFSEEEKAMLKNGDEMQRAATLAKIITDNVGNMNQALAGTDAGSMQRLSNTIGDLQENIGKNLQPVKSSWSNLMNGFKADWLKMVGNVTKTIGPFLTSFINGINSIVNLVRTILSPLFRGIGRLIDNAIGKPIRMLTKIFNAVFIPIIQTVTKVIKVIQNAFQYVADSIKSIFDPIKTWWQNYIGKAVAYLKAIYNVSIKPLIMNIVNPVVNMFNKVKAKFDSWINTIKEKIGGVFKEIKFEDHLLNILKGIFIIKNVFTAIFRYIKDYAIWVFESITTQPVQFFKSMFANILETFKNGIINLVEKIPDIDKDFFGINLHKIKEGLGGVGSGMQNAIEELRAGEDKLKPAPEFKSMQELLAMSVQEATEYMNKLRAEVEKSTEEEKKARKATEDNTNELKISDEWKNLLSEAAHRQFNLNYNQVTPSIHIDDVTINRDADSENFFSKVTDSIEQATGASVAYS